MALVRGLGIELVEGGAGARDLYTQAGRPAEGEPLLRDAVARARRLLPPGHAIIGASLRKHGVCLMRLGRYPEAEQTLLAAYESHRGGLGPEHTRTLHAARDLVELYKGWGKPEKR